MTKINFQHKQKKLELRYNSDGSLDSIIDTVNGYELTFTYTPIQRGYSFIEPDSQEQSANNPVGGVSICTAQYVYVPELKTYVPYFFHLEIE